MFVHVSVCLYVALITQLSQVHLESRRYHQNHIGKGILYSKFHKFSRNFGYISHFRPISTCCVSKAYTQAKKFIGDIKKGHRPQGGAKGPKKRPKASKRGRSPPKTLRKSQNKGRLSAPVFQSFISYSKRIIENIYQPTKSFWSTDFIDFDIHFF